MGEIVPEKDRMFNYEYVQLHSVAESGDSRLFHAEGPLVIGKAQTTSAGEMRPAVLHIGMPENMITWALTSDLPTLKVQRTAFMAAVPYSQRFYIIDFLPETPDDVLEAFERVLASQTSFAVANASAGGADAESTPLSTAAISPADQEQLEAPSGQTYTTTPATASKVHEASAAAASNIHQLGEHLGRGIVRAGEWYRKRSESKRTDLKISEAHMRRAETAKSMTERAAAVTTTVASKVGTALGNVAYGAKEGLVKSGAVREGGKVHRAGGKFKQGVIALIDVFDAMHDSARHVISTGAEETATCVQYRYGEQAGDLSRRSLGMAVDAYDVYGAYRAMRTRALAKAFFKGGFRSEARDDTATQVGTAGVVTDSGPSTSSGVTAGGLEGTPQAPAVGYGAKSESAGYMPPAQQPATHGIEGAGADARATDEDEYSVELVQPLEPRGDARWGWNR